MARQRNRRERLRQPASPLSNRPFRTLQNPLPPCEFLPQEQIEAIHEASLHILENVGTEFYQSALADRQSYDNWAAAGQADTIQRAHAIWRNLLDQCEPPSLDVAVREALADYVARRERELAAVNLYD
jgi:trimethylamine:corrinoid methyltransferase-like protein